MRLALVVIAACMLACSARSQDRMAARLRALVQQFERLTSKGWDTGSRQQAVEAAQEYLDALGASGERPVYEFMIEDLRRHSSGPFLLADTSVTRLLDEVKFQRTRGRPARMIPPLLVLKAGNPADSRVLYALGEAYGVASPVFDPERALSSFDALLEVLRERSEVATDPVGRGRLLAQFLPELSRAGLLLAEAPSDTTARMRQQLLAYREALRGGRPIGLWRLADPQMDRLYEQLSLARRALDQRRCREIIEAMLDMQPVNPVLQFSLAEVCMSRGPAFSRKHAMTALEAFLELTDPATLKGRAGQPAVVMSDADVDRDLARFRLAEPRSGLEEQRLAAHDYLAALRASMKRMEDGLLLCPDGARLEAEIVSLEKEISKLKKKIRSKNTYLSKARKNVAKYRAKEEDLRIPANIRGQHRQKRKQWERKVARYEQDIADIEAQIRPLREAVTRLERILGR